MKQTQLLTTTIALLLLFFSFSCTDLSLDEVLPDSHLLEEVYANSETEEYSPEKASCDDCSPEPGEISKFQAALNLSKYEYTGSSTQDASTYCSVGRFNTCRSWMVLQSSGSKDHRSELKLDQSVSFQDLNIMRTEAIYENVPSSSSKGLTIAQIHNRYQTSIGSSGRPLMRIELVNGKIRAVYAHSYEYGSSSTTNTLMDFNDGDRVYVKLQINGDGKKINYYVQNKSTGVSTSKTITVSSEWQSSTVRNYYYFKAGSYQQVASSGSNPRVSFARYEFVLN